LLDGANLEARPHPKSSFSLRSALVVFTFGRGEKFRDRQKPTTETRRHRKERN
jgi:hypothetical protein